MTISDFIWLATSSSAHEDGASLFRRERQRLRLLVAGAANMETVARFRHAEARTCLGRLMAARPETIGALVWPYQCAAWGPRERLENIATHCEVIDALGPPLDFAVDGKLQLLDLGEHHDGLRVILDQPRWFAREGLLALNLFVDDFRAYSLSFSFGRDRDGTRVAIIGGIQGRNREGVLDLYRALTKALFGIRPRDMLIELLRMICRCCEAHRILAVTDAQRHHRHPYFGKQDFTIDYDEIWEDRGGERVSERFYRLDTASEERDLSTLKPNKRSMYRKRYAFLAELDSGMPAAMAAARPVSFRDT